MDSTLFVGAAEMDITPPVGTLMAGSLDPRPSVGTADPLQVKAIILEHNGIRMAYAIFDLVALDALFGEHMVTEAARESGIPADHIVWSCTHTHSGPCSAAGLYPSCVPDPVNHKWRDSLPSALATCLRQADARKVPARVRRTRGYRHDLGHNRRVRMKDGHELNTWLLHQGEDAVQSLGAAGPIDPEVGILSFEDLNGGILAVLFHFSVHANAHFSDRFSGDYPAVTAARLRERFGPRVCTLFMPGACGDQNPVRSHREIGNALADTIIGRLEANPALMEDVRVGIRRERIRVPLRNLAADQEARLLASQWNADARRFFRRSQRDLQRQRLGAFVDVNLQAWRIGDVAFAMFPGELFVELGLQLKAASPFPWTYPVELSQGCFGYLVTRSAWKAGGYESLVASTGLVSPVGCEKMVRHNLKMLSALRRPR